MTFHVIEIFRWLVVVLACLACASNASRTRPLDEEMYDLSLNSRPQGFASFLLALNQAVASDGTRAPHSTSVSLTSHASSVLGDRLQVTKGAIVGSESQVLGGGNLRESLAHRRNVFMQASGDSPKMLVFGGTGYLGSRICKEAVNRGFSVVAVSRRGQNPLPEDISLSQVEWESLDAQDATAVKSLIQRVDPDVVVHTVGLLFDIDSGLGNFNNIVSGSGSVPGSSSTYDVVTRQTAMNAFQAIVDVAKNPFKNPLAPERQRTFAFISCAEAGWPDVPGGDAVEKIAPDWLKRYLSAKRSVESALESQRDVRTLRFRPSLIWSWGKLDVLPIIPLFNAAAALGVPFVDKTVQVETLAKSIVEAIVNGEEGIKRVGDMERLAAQSASA